MPLINSPSGGASGTILFCARPAPRIPTGNGAERHTEASVRGRARNGTGMGRKWRHTDAHPYGARAREDKAMTIGQRVDPASSRAWLGRCFFWTFELG